MHSSAVVRAGLVTTALLTLSLTASAPAFAVEYAGPQPGESCTDSTGLDPALTCSGGVVTVIQTAEPAPTVEAPSPSAEPTTDPTPEPTTDPAPVPDPVPVVPDPTPPADTPAPDGGVAAPPAPAPADPPASGGPVASDPGPGTPSAPGASLLDGAKGDPAAAEGSTEPGVTLHAAAIAADPASTTRSLLTAATLANLAAGDLPILAMNSPGNIPGSAGSPLSAFTPSPLLANLPATQAIAAVQAPLLAAGDEAAAGGGFTLAGLSSKALPGLLVVLATALVAAVAAGNLRVWQERFPQFRR
jgi:hypothetical protein